MHRISAELYPGLFRPVLMDSINMKPKKAAAQPETVAVIMA
jgi:hypothetical protein